MIASSELRNLRFFWFLKDSAICALKNPTPDLWLYRQWIGPKIQNYAGLRLLWSEIGRCKTGCSTVILYGFRVTYEGFLGINSANQGVGCLLYLGMFEIAQLPEQVSRKAHQSHGKKLLHKLLFPYLQGQKFSVHSTLL